jgi:hypothetical protein
VPATQTTIRRVVVTDFGMASMSPVEGFSSPGRYHVPL